MALSKKIQDELIAQGYSRNTKGGVLEYTDTGSKKATGTKATVKPQDLVKTGTKALPVIPKAPATAPAVTKPTTTTAPPVVSAPVPSAAPAPTPINIQTVPQQIVQGLPAANLPQAPTFSAAPELGTMPQAPTFGAAPELGALPQAPNYGSAPQLGALPQAPVIDPYQMSPEVRSAYEIYQNMLGAKPGEYQSTYQPQMDALMNQYGNREPFKYDLNADMLYQQMRDQYTRNGQLAMMDTQGQAAGLTGGYGSTYGMQAGQQAYDAHLQELNNNIPALYDRKYGEYQDAGNQLLNQFNMAGQMEGLDYGQYRDTVSDWFGETQMAGDRYNTDCSFDYGQYSDTANRKTDQYKTDTSNYWNKAGYDYQSYSDEAARKTDQYGMDVNNYWNKAGYDYQAYSDDANRKMDLYGMDVNNYWNNANYDYTKYSDETNLAMQKYLSDTDVALTQQGMEADQQRWAEEFGFKKSEADYAKQLDTRDFNYQLQKDAATVAAKGSSGGSSKSKVPELKANFTADQVAAVLEAQKTGGPDAVATVVEGLEWQGDYDPNALLGLYDYATTNMKYEPPKEKQSPLASMLQPIGNWVSDFAGLFTGKK